MRKKKTISEHKADGTPRPERHDEWRPGYLAEPPLLMSTPAAAHLLGIHRETLYLYEKLGVISSVRLVPGGQRRFRRADVVRLAEEGHWLDADDADKSDGVDEHFSHFRATDDE